LFLFFLDILRSGKKTFWFCVQYFLHHLLDGGTQLFLAAQLLVLSDIWQRVDDGNRESGLEFDIPVAFR
jgi:hypothetical protein